MSSENEDFDALEWEALEPARPQSINRPDVSITLLKKMNKPHRPPCRAMANLWMRGKVGAWIVTNGPMFSIEMSGVDCLRVVADKKGRFKACNWRGTKRISLGHVNVWPDETRRQTSVEFWFRPGYIVLKLPNGFAKPAPQERPPAKETFLVDIGGVQVTKDESALLESLLNNKTVNVVELKRSKVSVDRIRMKVKHLGIEIETVFGGGLRMDAGSKARLRTFLEKAA
jgi:hypothetical protein